MSAELFQELQSKLRDMAKTDWEVARQRIFVIGQEVKILDAQLSREWGRS